VVKVLSSSGWLLSERAITLALNFLVSIVLARYLGPRDFGSLSYALAFVALLGTIPYLGFGAVVVQELVRKPGQHDETMGVVFYSKLAAASLAFGLANVIAYFVIQEPINRLLVLLISFSMLFDASVGLRLHFEARTQAAPVVAVASAANAFGAIARVGAVILMAPLWFFGAIVSIQSAIAAFGFWVIYRNSVGSGSRLLFTRMRARELFGKSWPLIISAAAATIYLKVDQFMLGQMRGMRDVGTFAVAARLSEVWYTLPIAVASSFFPRLIELRSADPARYRRRMQDSVRYLFWLGVLIALPISLLAQPVMTFLFGDPYAVSGTILAIHIWACPAVFMGIAVEKWFVAEDLLKFLIGRQLISALINVLLNLLLIPPFGGVGSAVATVVAYTFAYYLSCFTSSRTRPAGIWMSEAIVWPVIRWRQRKQSSG
jgi:O-antigen/teichoic acid export membrane protein